jgi:vacuolar-type H+-ATPase subunit I/STV1
MIEDKLNKEIGKLQKWTHNNELEKFNKIIMVLTFFIGVGEISNIVKNYLSVESQGAYIKLTLMGFIILSIFMLWIFKIHEKRLGGSIKQTYENGRKIINTSNK